MKKKHAQKPPRSNQKVKQKEHAKKARKLKRFRPPGMSYNTYDQGLPENLRETVARLKAEVSSREPPPLEDLPDGYR